MSHAFRMRPDDAGFDELCDHFLELYRANVYRETRLFPGVPEVLDHIESQALSWGIVTNKTSWLTDPLVQELGLSQRAACVVSGDTLNRRKPHPDPRQAFDVGHSDIIATREGIARDHLLR